MLKLCGATLILLLALLPTRAIAQNAKGFTVTDLGTLDGYEVYPENINNLGQVVGFGRVYVPAYGYAYTKPFLWTKEHGMVNLDPFSGDKVRLAYHINDLGQVVGDGNVDPDGWHALMWTLPGKTMTDLGTLGGRTSLPYYGGINNLGQVAGRSTSPSGMHAFLWTPENGMIDLGSLQETMPSYAQDINDSGWVVGTSAAHAFLWTPENGMVDLGTLGGTSSYPMEINSLGQVVGESTTVSGDTHAFLWTPENGMNDLGTLGGGYSRARHINDSGWVVGSSDRHTFVWTPQEGMIGLGTLGGDSSYPLGINNLGWIVGESETADRRWNAFLWTPENGMQDLGESFTPTGINDRGQVIGQEGLCCERRALLLEFELTLPVPQTQIDAMISEVNSLVQTGSLSEGQGSVLTAKLDAAKTHLGSTSATLSTTRQSSKESSRLAASNLVHAFANQVQALINAGELSSVEGISLIIAATTLIDELNGASLAGLAGQTNRLFLPAVNHQTPLH